MRKILFILFCVISLSLSATDYYVKTGGNDAASGLDDANAWGTISKVNSVWAAGTFAPGDNIYFKRGDTFVGTITVTESGTSGNPITIGAYGTGDKPIITGLTEVTGWSDYSGNIKSKAVSVGSTPQILLRDGVNTAYGRWPKSTYMFLESATSTSLTDNELPSSPDYDGGTAVIRTIAWVIEKKTVTHTNQTLTYTATEYTPTAGHGYFIQNHLSTLTQTHDWAYLSGTVYYYSPAGYTIEIPTLDRLIVINGYSYITITDLELSGANTEAIFLQSASYVSIEDCDIVNCGGYGVRGVSSVSYITVDNCVFDEINNMGIRFTGNYCAITNNTITNIGKYPGMGYVASGDLDHALTAIEAVNYTSGQGNYTISYNTINNVGYDGISFGGKDTEVSYNTVSNFCFVKDDGGGIYTYNEYNTGKVVKYNFVYNGIGAAYGRPGTIDGAHGIYNDGGEYTTYTNNVCWDNAYIGLFVNDCENVTATYNTLYNNKIQLEMLIREEGSNVLNYNVLVSRQKDDNWYQSCFHLVLRGEFAYDYYGTSDYNYFVRPTANDDYIYVYYNAWESPYITYLWNLTEWKAASGQDANSQTTPVTVATTSNIHFIYNNTASDVFYNVSAPMVDAKGGSYNGMIKLDAWTALVLLGEGSVTKTDEEPPSVNRNVFSRDSRGNFMKDSNGIIMIIE